MPDRTRVKFRSGQNATENNPPIENGTFTYDSNGNKLYLDFNDQRNMIGGGSVMLNMTAQEYEDATEEEVAGKLIIVDETETVEPNNG